jgi:PAS domain S-box-containing protein
MSQTRILVVEDEGIVSLEIQSRLRSFGYHIAGTADTGEEAIVKAAQTQPNLILMDIRLKGKLNGIMAADHIRVNFDIPVIYLTAYADEHTLKQAKVTEPFAYLLKPFEERDLYTAIEMALYRHKMEQKLKASERWLRTVLHSIGDAVIATNHQGHVEFLNPLAENLSGWAKNQVQGEPLEQAFKLKLKTEAISVKELFGQALRADTAIPLLEYSLLTKQGQEIPIEGMISAIAADNGQVGGVVLVFRDISQRQQQEQAIRHYNEQLQSQNQELDAFAHTVAHDLQSPLGKVIGFADVLRKYHAEMSLSEINEHLQIVAQTGRQMSNIINELLLLSGVRKTTVQPKPVEMAAIIAEAQDRLEDMIVSSQAEVILPSAWPVALGYGPWLAEVWVNYLSNAIKYGGQPPRIELGADGPSNQTVRFWLRDNGPGLSPEAQAQLFTPFTRLHQVRARGHGLGLSIVRRIVEKLGGQVGVESSGIAGQGCLFYFTLPATTEFMR